MNNTAKGLTHENLATLLGILDPDTERAAARYEALRERLTKLFAWRRCKFPETLADQTLDRVARQLANGLELHAKDPFRYAAGVAHRVFQETVRREIRERKTAQEAATQVHSASTDETTEREQALVCLDRCLEALAESDRRLLMRFYEGEQGNRIAARKALAARLAVTRNALRIRACRLRARLETCVRGCLAEHETSAR